MIAKVWMVIDREVVLGIWGKFKTCQTFVIIGMKKVAEKFINA